MSKNLEIYGYSNRGFEGQVIKIDTDIHPGFPGFDIIGLPDSAIKESRDRVRTALRNCNFKFPQQHVLVSLSPASVPKQGASLDLGIALSILFASDKNRIDIDGTIRIMTAGELALDGKVVQDNACIGALEAARKLKCHLCLVPFSVKKTSTVFEIPDLVTAFIKCGEYLNSCDDKPVMTTEKEDQGPIFSDIIALNEQKEYLAICASGMHSVLLFGPPGVGKTLLSNRICRLLSRLDDDDAEEVTHIYGCAGIDVGDAFVPKTQIVAHDCSLGQFVGGAVQKSPGIGAMAHCGTLVLDEITKYTPKLLEAVKDAYDKGRTISCKGGDTVCYPSRFMMIGNMNACSCGGLGSRNTACTCNSHRIESYWNKIGRPLLERFDVRMPIEEIDIPSLVGSESKPDSYYLEKISTSVERQKHRYKEYNIKYNGQIHFESSILSLFRKDVEILSKMDCGIQNNVRSLISIISLARSFADWDDRNDVTENDILVAINMKKYGLGDYFWRTIR